MSDKTLTAKEIRGDVAEIAQKLEQIELLSKVMN